MNRPTTTPPSHPHARRRVSAWCIALCVMIISFITASAASARTITLNDTDVFHLAHIGREVPDAGWLGRHSSPGIFVNNFMDMTPGRRFLIKYPLDRIPPGQRIVSATWIIPYTYAPATPTKLYIWRIMAPWGPGVNQKYRTQVPQPVEWAAPGLGAPGIDRAITPTAIKLVEGTGEIQLDVTQDIDTWYTGVAPNHGWVVAIDEANSLLRIDSPLYTGRGKFLLRITYEPE